MHSQPKLIVIKMRELLYTLILMFLVGLLILCMVLMFTRKTAANDSLAASRLTASVVSPDDIGADTVRNAAASS